MLGKAPYFTLNQFVNSLRISDMKENYEELQLHKHEILYPKDKGMMKLLLEKWKQQLQLQRKGSQTCWTRIKYFRIIKASEVEIRIEMLPICLNYW